MDSSNVISFVAMPTLVVTRELAGNFSFPPHMNVYYFGENFSPSTCTSHSSRKKQTKPKTLGVNRQPEQGSISLSIFQFFGFLFNLYWFMRQRHVFLFLLHNHKVVYSPAWELTVSYNLGLCWKINGLAQVPGVVEGGQNSIILIMFFHISNQ